MAASMQRCTRMQAYMIVLLVRIGENIYWGEKRHLKSDLAGGQSAIEVLFRKGAIFFANCLYTTTISTYVGRYALDCIPIG